MLPERRGPEYVRPEEWLAKQEAARRRTKLIMWPVVASAGAALGLAIWLPMKSNTARFDRMMKAIGNQPPYHAIERRAGDATGVLREDYVNAQRRRYILLEGEAEVISGLGSDQTFEKTPLVARKHHEALVTMPILGRLAIDCLDVDIKIGKGEGGTLTVEKDRRRYEIELNKDGLPKFWKTLVMTDLGFEPLWETTVDYGPISNDKFQSSIKPTLDVNMESEPDPRTSELPAQAKIGPIELVRIDVNSLGDVILLIRSPYERPYFEVKDSDGRELAPVSLYANPYRTGSMYRSETMCIRLSEEPLTWPVKVTLRARNYNPRFKVEGFANKEVGTYTFSAPSPTCSFAPTYWFDNMMTDRVYFDYLRTRAYRLSNILQNAMRTKDGALVDTLNGGATGLSEDDLVKSPHDNLRAITEMKKVIRLRAEYEGGSIPISSLYVQLASMYLASGQKELAKSAVQFAESRIRLGRADPSLVADIERLSREIDQ